MMSKAYSAESNLLVLMFTGSDSSMEEYEETVRAFSKLISETVNGTSIAIIVVAAEHAQPNAYWRKRFVAVHQTARRPLRIGVVTQSILIRGVMTAIDWLMRSETNYRSQAFVSFEDAVVTYEKELGQPLDTLRILYRLTRDSQRLQARRAPL